MQFDGGSSITLTQLSYAVALDTHRHFARAARACNVSQPTLSMQLQKLETALGATLFDRTRTPVIPTDIGIALLDQARVALREIARLGDMRDAYTGTIAGELRLAVIPTLAPYLLPAVLELLGIRHPQLELVVEERVTESVLEGLRDDTLDAGLVATDVDTPGVIGRTLFHEPFFGYVSQSHRLAGRQRLAVSDLLLDDLWLLSEGHCLRTQVVTLCRQRRSGGSGRARNSAPGCTRVARFESGNLETLKGLVERGVGMTLLPGLAASGLATNAQRRLLVPFADPVPGRSIRLVRGRRHLREHLVRAVVAIVREVAESMLPDKLGRLRANVYTRGLKS
ncbi:MAG: LysR substrate-binding domain-containing protein [Gemmatimonadales bacterium]